MSIADRVLLDAVVSLAREAGDAILKVYDTDFCAGTKSDSSPVTEADQQAESVILEGLQRLAPGWPCIAEEAVSGGDIPPIGDVFWLVDPLDGTREFISRNGEFTVNIALVDRQVPVLGVVLAPAKGVVYYAAQGIGAWRESGEGAEKLRVAPMVPDQGLVVVSSRSHGDAQALESFLAGRRVSGALGVGSSLKFCMVAEGCAHLYPRLGPTMEWDTAAGHAVVAEAGGFVRDLEGQPLRYGKPSFRNPYFVAGCEEPVDR